MAPSSFPGHVVSMLQRPNPCTITTLRADGQPVSVATWYLLDGDRILVNMDHSRRRLQHLRDDPRVALTVLDRDSWYNHVSVVGRVVDMADDPDLRDIDRLSQHYLGKPYAVRDSPRVSAWVEVERWHGWGATKD
jgi:PPOX class probable F420-dependent enzyme